MWASILDYTTKPANHSLVAWVVEWGRISPLYSWTFRGGDFDVLFGKGVKV
jgi:hypothetical protein